MTTHMWEDAGLDRLGRVMISCNNCDAIVISDEDDYKNLLDKKGCNGCHIKNELYDICFINKMGDEHFPQPIYRCDNLRLAIKTASYVSKSYKMEIIIDSTSKDFNLFDNGSKLL